MSYLPCLCGAFDCSWCGPAQGYDDLGSVVPEVEFDRPEAEPCYDDPDTTIPF